MCALLRFSAGGLAAVLTTAYVAASAETGMSAFRPTIMEPAAAQTVVNRVNKGDREVTIRDAGRPAIRVQPTRAATEPKILEGCDPAFSPLTAPKKNNFAGRCLV